LQARLEKQGITVYCITLAACRDNILAAKRGRIFTPGERDRIEEMLSQGYAKRPFSDCIIRTDQSSFADTLKELEKACQALLALP